MDGRLSVNNLILRQGKTFSLKVSQLELLPRRIYALTGPNGAGKSTLLKLLAFLTVPQQGTIRISGCHGGLGAQRRQVTLVEQSPYLLDGTVADNLVYGLKLRSITGRERQQRIDSALQRVGLAGFAQRRSDELSGGETQRVALARALALQPKVLLLDEPTANFDNMSLAIFDELLRTLPDEGITVIFSTHDPSQPERLRGETIRIDNGRLLNTPHRVKTSGNLPRNEKRPWPEALNMYAR
ncbi:energy-coupling factor ABC transporter ATP-binding protein [Malonomonas rubra]|uniref:energy-coupling factor ABC transporter ATP-binding protein n=1 Tax=Malonomonas rubra TaxID=57040 RepID=UPI0026ED961B|nr:ABC transporter ATP-binding protein [Malonomonas rubra]